MVKIIFTREGNYYKSLEMSGHANYDVHGSDIVCSAASVLGFTLINYFTEVVGISMDNLKLEINEAEEASELYVELLEGDDYMKESVQNGFEFFRIGAVGLVESYENYIELINREV